MKDFIVKAAKAVKEFFVKVGTAIKAGFEKAKKFFTKK